MRSSMQARPGIYHIYQWCWTRVLIFEDLESDSDVNDSDLDSDSDTWDSGLGSKTARIQLESTVFSIVLYLEANSFWFSV